MDQEKFDDLARQLVAPTRSRRWLLGGVVAGVVAATSTAIDNIVEAKKGKGRKGRKANKRRGVSAEAQGPCKKYHTLVCHKDNAGPPDLTLCVNDSALPAHLAHGDCICGSGCDCSNEEGKRCGTPVCIGRCKKTGDCDDRVAGCVCVKQDPKDEHGTCKVPVVTCKGDCTENKECPDLKDCVCRFDSNSLNSGGSCGQCVPSGGSAHQASECCGDKFCADTKKCKECPPCVPKTCQDFPGKCGKLQDGCGNEIICGCGDKCCVNGDCVTCPPEICEEKPCETDEDCPRNVPGGCVCTELTTAQNITCESSDCPPTKVCKPPVVTCKGDCKSTDDCPKLDKCVCNKTQGAEEGTCGEPQTCKGECEDDKDCPHVEGGCVCHKQDSKSNEKGVCREKRCPDHCPCGCDGDRCKPCPGKCDGVHCTNGCQCNPFTGQCHLNCPPPPNPCDSVQCMNGCQCDARTGQCIVDCPPPPPVCNPAECACGCNAENTACVPINECPPEVCVRPTGACQATADCCEDPNHKLECVDGVCLIKNTYHCDLSEQCISRRCAWRRRNGRKVGASEICLAKKQKRSGKRRNRR